jgi:hypothetical protein
MEEGSKIQKELADKHTFEMFQVQWTTCQDELSDLCEQRDELNRRVDEAWGIQNGLHRKGVESGYKLDRKTMKWSDINGKNDKRSKN